MVDWMYAHGAAPHLNPHASAADHDRLLALWKAWRTVLYTMLESTPSPLQIRDFKKDVHHLFVLLVRTVPDRVWGGFYWHLLLAHLDEYLQEYKSLAKYANQGAEAKHKEGLLAWIRAGCGGTFGRKAPGPEVSATSDNKRFLAHGLKLDMDAVLSAQEQDGAATAAAVPSAWGCSAAPVTDTAPGPARPEASESDDRRRSLQLRGLRGVVETLVLLNYVRMVPYCEEHDTLNCACGEATSAIVARRRPRAGTRHLQRMELHHAREDLQAVLAHRQDPHDDEDEVLSQQSLEDIEEEALQWDAEPELAQEYAQCIEESPQGDNQDAPMPDSDCVSATSAVAEFAEHVAQPDLPPPPPRKRARMTFAQFVNQ